MQKNNIKLNNNEKLLLYSAFIRIICDVNRQYEIPIVFQKIGKYIPIMPGNIHDIEQTMRIGLAHCQLKAELLNNNDDMSLYKFAPCMVGIPTPEHSDLLSLSDEMLVGLFWAILHEACHVFTIAGKSFSHPDAESKCALRLIEELPKYVGDKLAKKIGKFQTQKIMKDALGHYEQHVENLVNAYCK